VATERELFPDVWVRTALDQHQLDRQEAYEVLTGVPADHRVVHVRTATALREMVKVAP